MSDQLADPSSADQMSTSSKMPKINVNAQDPAPTKLLEFDKYGNLNTILQYPPAKKLVSCDDEPIITKNYIKIKQKTSRNLSKYKEIASSNLLNGIVKGDGSSRSLSKNNIVELPEASSTQQDLQKAFKEFQSAPTSQYGRTRKRKMDEHYYHGTINFNELRKFNYSSSKRRGCSVKRMENTLDKCSLPKGENVLLPLLRDEPPIGCHLDKIWENELSVASVSYLNNNINSNKISTHTRKYSYQCITCYMVFASIIKHNNHIKIHSRGKQSQINELKMFRINHKKDLTKTLHTDSDTKRQIFKTITSAGLGNNPIGEAVIPNICYQVASTKPFHNDVIENRENNATMLTKSHALMDNLNSQNESKTTNKELKKFINKLDFSKGQAELNIAKESEIVIKTHLFKENELIGDQENNFLNLIETKSAKREEQGDWEQYELYDSINFNEVKVEIKDEPIDSEVMDYDCMLNPKIEVINDPTNSVTNIFNDRNEQKVERAEYEFNCEKSDTDIWNQLENEVKEEQI